MPELLGPPLRPQLARHAGGARLLLDHIRRGRELVRRFEIGWDDEANDAYRAWGDRSRVRLATEKPSTKIAFWRGRGRSVRGLAASTPERERRAQPRGRHTHTPPTAHPAPRC